MPKLQVPTDVLGVVGDGVNSRNPQGEKTVTVLVQTLAGEMTLRMTPAVAADLYKVVCEE